MLQECEILEIELALLALTWHIGRETDPARGRRSRSHPDAIHEEPT